MPAKPETKFTTPRQIHNSVTTALRAALDPKLETQLGWLHSGRRITARQHEAGERFGRLARAYGHAIAAPRRNARTGVMERTARGSGIEPAEDIEHTARARMLYETARQRLKALGAFEAIVSLCVDDQHPAPDSWEALRKGLGELVGFFRL